MLSKKEMDDLSSVKIEDVQIIGTPVQAALQQSDNLLEALVESRDIYNLVQSDHYYLGQTDEQLKTVNLQIVPELNRRALNAEAYRFNAKEPIENLILRAEDRLKRNRILKVKIPGMVHFKSPSSAQTTCATNTMQIASLGITDLKTSSEDTLLRQDLQTAIQREIYSQEEVLEKNMGIWNDPENNDSYLGVCVTFGTKQCIKLTSDSYQGTPHANTRIISVRKWYLGEISNAKRYLDILSKEAEKPTINLDKLLSEMAKVEQTIRSASKSLQIELKKQLNSAKYKYYQVCQLVESDSSTEETCKKIRNLIRDLNSVRGYSNPSDWNGFPYRYSTVQTNNYDWDNYLKVNDEADLYDYENTYEEEIEKEWYIYLAEQEKAVLLNAKKIVSQLKINCQSDVGVISQHIVINDEKSLKESETNLIRQNNNLAKARYKVHRFATDCLEKDELNMKNLLDFQQKYNAGLFSIDGELNLIYLEIGVEIQLLDQKIKKRELELQNLMRKYPPIIVEAIAGENLNQINEDGKKQSEINSSKKRIKITPKKYQELTKTENENLIKRLFQPDRDKDKDPKRISNLNWWPELARRINRLKTKEEGDFTYECWGFRGVSEEGAVILQEGPCLAYLLGWGSTFGTIRQIRKLWPQTEQESFNIDAILGLAGGMVGFVIGSIRMGYLDPYSKVAHTIFLSLAEACSIFIFVTGEIITIYCNDKTHWFPATDNTVLPNNVTNSSLPMECMVSDATFATHFVPGPATTALWYFVFNTMWNLVPNQKKLRWLASNDGRTRLLAQIGYGTDYLLKTLLFSRIFQFSMMSINVSEAISYEYAALPAAFLVAYIQRRKPTTQQRMYALVLGLLGGVMLYQNIKTTLALCGDGIYGSNWGTGLASIVLDVVALGGSGILSAIGFRQAVNDYMLIEDSNPIDTLTLISRIENLVREEVTKHYQTFAVKPRLNLNSEFILDEMRAKVRNEVAITYLEAFHRTKNRSETLKIYVSLQKCLERIVHKVTDEVIGLIDQSNIKSDVDLAQSPIPLNVAPISNYFSRTKPPIPSSPGIMLPAYPPLMIAEPESYNRLSDDESNQVKTKEMSDKKNSSAGSAQLKAKAPSKPLTPAFTLRTQQLAANTNPNWRNLWGWSPF